MVKYRMNNLPLMHLQLSYPLFLNVFLLESTGLSLQFLEVSVHPHGQLTPALNLLDFCALPLQGWTAYVQSAWRSRDREAAEL